MNVIKRSSDLKDELNVTESKETTMKLQMSHGKQELHPELHQCQIHQNIDGR